MNIKITGSGRYVPELKVSNADFAKHVFLNDDGTSVHHPNEIIISKFKDITGISERRYADKELVTSDIAYFAAKKAIEDSGVDVETLDYIILAHNFGDVRFGSSQSDIMPSLASRVKNSLGIKNPRCVAYDILFGCPGWIEGMLQANAFIKSGMAKKCLVIGAETLSRVVDRHDRDAMIYADGAGATIVEATDDNHGLLAYESCTYSFDLGTHLFYVKSNNPDLDPDVRYIKMFGRKIYEFALNYVPQAMQSCLEKSGLKITDVSKILIHQANEKMDDAIVHRFYKLYNQTPPPNIMPMSIHMLGNSSVATVPTLYDMIIKNEVENQQISKGDVLIFASVGAGMNINAFVYRY